VWKTVVAYGSLSAIFFLAMVFFPGNLLVNSCLGAAAVALLGWLLRGRSLTANALSVAFVTVLMPIVTGYMICMPSSSFFTCTNIQLQSIGPHLAKFLLPVAIATMFQVALSTVFRGTSLRT
jgi:hypothetical protein